MFSFIYNKFFYEPLFNLLVFFAFFMPGNNLGLSIIAVTIIAKLIILPITHSSMKAQKKMKELQPVMDRIKKEYEGKKEEQALQMMNLYKEHGINPFSSIFLIFLQLPIFIALYYMFRTQIDLTSSVLYSFTPVPSFISVNFLGLDLLSGSLFLAVLVSLSQFAQSWFAVPPLPKSDKKESTFQEDLAKSMNLQVKYVLPIFIGFVAYKLNAAVSLFWITNNILGIIHELYIRNKSKSL